MKKIYLLFILVLTNVTSLWGQNLDYVPQIAPPSPEAYKLSRYGDIQLQGNTGAFTHSIPIYDIKFHEINLPITLSYSSNGVLVDELSGFTGTSWTLNAGGVISRTVRGVPDEEAQERWYPDSIEPLNANALKIKLYADKDNVTRDSQQDWFFINIGNISTSFFFDENLNILKSNDDNVRIEYLIKNSVLEFKITDKKGVVYILGGSDDYMEKNAMSQDCVGGPKTTYYSAWYLKEIITPNNQKIFFEYNSFQQSFISSASYNETYIPTCTKGAPLNSFFNRSSSNCRSINETTSKALSSIIFGNNKVVFDYRRDRKDEGSLLLSNISVYNKAQLIKREELIYDEIFNNENVQDPRLYSNLSIKYRYFLKEINNYNNSNIFQNKYFFDYYNLISLPPRLSWNKDLYGYYNGKSNYSTFDKSLIVNPETNFIIRNQASSFTADLSVNPNTAYYGMLKRITYPSKGYSDIEYESNSNNVNGLKEAYKHEELRVSKDNCGDDPSYETPESSFEFTSNGENIHFTTGFSVSKCPGHEDDIIDFHNISIVQVFDITNGKNQLVFDKRGGYSKENGIISIKNIRTAESGETTSEHVFSPITTVPGNKYKVLIQAETRINKISLRASFKYNKTVEPYTYTKYYGGVRVASTTDFDGISNTNKKDYFYNTYQQKNTGFTTIKDNNLSKLYEKTTYTMYCEGQGSLCGNMPGQCLNPVEGAIKLTINNSSINQLYNTRSQSVGYGIITSISNSNNQNNGYTENYFYNKSDNSSDTYQGTKIYGTPSSNNSEGYTSTLLKSKTFNSNNILLNETENIYSPIKNLRTVKNWIFKKNYEFQHPVMDDWIYNHSIERYQNFSRTVKPTKTISKEYLSGGTITTETNYNYDSPNHLQLTKQTTTNSKGETLTTEYQYPPDWAGNAIADKLTAQNRISEPLTIVQKLNENTVISAVYNEYKEFNGVNGIIEKSGVFQKKGSSQFVEADRKITYNSYDAKGNLLQYTLENGIPVSIIWGYNGQYPVAKIEGSTFANATSKLANYLTKIQNGTLTATEQSTIRTLIPDAMLTSYTYKPLIGVTSITGPNGQSEFYNYDSSNRLQSIVNEKNEVIKTFEYNYKQP
ncbi:hypothetical protein [Empedobacter tilapiae]|uniref:hypothetical protein n=1 Tax=Empedobacter tilapiae TaxID=2491114 RepID=UPI0028D25A4C|nr:hypothetical protein [Empedobacter tilapiae]